MDSKQNGMSLFSTDITIFNIIREIVGTPMTDMFSQTVLIPDELGTFGDENVSRAQLSMSLFLVLYGNLLERVPSAFKYFERKRENQESIFLDHGAVRTVDTPRNGSLPIGQLSLIRVLMPLGYFHNETYPLKKLKMTGRSYAHSDFPESIPQYFVSELHPELFENDDFEKTVINVVEDSKDPLTKQTLQELAFIEENKFLPRDKCSSFLANIAHAFGRQHPDPLLSDYETLLEYSAEMAWIATEGNAFNHATDRVEDVMALSEDEKELGMPIKDTVEVSKNGNIFQTAYRADPIIRNFRLDDNRIIEKEVPGSFFEFITRKRKEDGIVDLSFDASNATGIFAMTREESQSDKNLDNS